VVGGDRCFVVHLVFSWQQMDLSEDNGRFSVLADGTLVIQRVVTDDAGEYVCEAQSPAGSAFAKAKLNVRGEKNYADAV